MWNSSLSPCGALARRHDRDRYLASLLLPAPYREHAFTLIAFNAELARIPSLVSDEMIGHIRFAWWREALQELADGKPSRGHPVLQALGTTIQAESQLMPMLEQLLDARESDLAKKSPDNLLALENYAEKTASNILIMTSYCVQIHDKEFHACAKEIGIAWGLVGLLHSTIPLLKQGRVMFPRQLLELHGIDEEQLLNGQFPERLSSIVEAIVDNANKHLDKSVKINIPKARFLAFYRALAKYYLTTFARHGFDLKKTASCSELYRLWLLLKLSVMR